MNRAPFFVPTCGVANTRPEDMDADTFAAWLDCLTNPADRERWTKRREQARAALTLEAPTADQLADEASRNAQRAEVARRQAEPIRAGRVDTTGDLFDQYHATAPLFAAPTPRPQEARP